MSRIRESKLPHKLMFYALLLLLFNVSLMGLLKYKWKNNTKNITGNDIHAYLVY